MNYRGKRKTVRLKDCPVCGMDSGIRKMTVRVPESFFVVCECCGFMTKPHKSQEAATKEWNCYKRCGNED